MKTPLCVLVTAIVLLAVPTLCDAARNVTVSYTLLTVNSPDCDSSIGDYPVSVQHRRVAPVFNTVIEGQGSSNNASEWMYPYSDETSKFVVVLNF